MAALKNVRVFLDGYDLSGDLNAAAFDEGAAMLDGTHFGDNTRINTPGLLTARVQHEGHWRANGVDAPDDVLFPNFGVANAPTTLCPVTADVGSLAFFFRTAQAEYSLGGPVGELIPFSVAAESDEGLAAVRGKVLQAPGSVIASGTSTPVQVGAATADQTAYFVLHVLSASASDTLDVVVQSDVDAAFATPVTVATFAQQTAVGSAWIAVAGANSDTYYRVSYTLGGISPDFSFVVAAGVI
jgi:hypothetical protein